MTINELIEYGYQLLATAFMWLARGMEALFDPFSELSFAERIGELTVGQFAFTLAICLFLLLQAYRELNAEADGFLPRWLTWILAIATTAIPLWFIWTRIFAYQGGA